MSCPLVSFLVKFELIFLGVLHSHLIAFRKLEETWHAPSILPSPAHKHQEILHGVWVFNSWFVFLLPNCIEICLIGSLSCRECEQMEEGKLLIPFSHLIDWDITKIKKTRDSLCIRIWSSKPLVVLGSPNTKLCNYHCNLSMWGHRGKCIFSLPQTYMFNNSPPAL